MQQLTNISNPSAPKVFGHLYIAIFSNGTVKAGMSGRSPGDRVNSHANAGKAFGISMDSSFCVSIYTDDTKARERLMHQEISALATLTAGREWFKFDSATMAVNFASAYLCRVERMSFAERPSVEEIALRVKSSNKALESLFPMNFAEPAKAFTLPAPATDADLVEMASVMNEYSLSVLASIAGKIVCLEGDAFEHIEGVAPELPVLSDVIHAHFAEHARICDPNGKLLTPAAEAYVDEVLKQGHPFSRESAVKIIQAAALYPAFFYEAMGFKVAA